MDGEVDMDGGVDGLVPGRETGLLVICLLGRGRDGVMDLVLAGDYLVILDTVIARIIPIIAEEDIIRSIHIHMDMIILQNIIGE